MKIIIQEASLKKIINSILSEQENSILDIKKGNWLNDDYWK